MSRLGRIASLKGVRGRVDNGGWTVSCLNNILDDIADDLNNAVKSSQLSVSDGDFTGKKDTDPDSDRYIQASRNAISDEIDACVDADTQDALRVVHDLFGH